ncbi:hypothetical protein Tco_1469413, partial [Tanacetum coccineum]
DYCVTTSNRGHVLSAGLTTDPAFGLTGTMRSGSIYATHTCSPYEEIRILKKQNDDLKKKMEDAEAQRVADQLALQKTLNLPELLNRILWEISGKIFVRNQWEITVGNLWQKCEKWLIDNVGNPWEIVKVPWENQWENIYPRGFLHRNNSVGNL